MFHDSQYRFLRFSIERLAYSLLVGGEWIDKNWALSSSLARADDAAENNKKIWWKVPFTIPGTGKSHYIYSGTGEIDSQGEYTSEPPTGENDFVAEAPVPQRPGEPSDTLKSLLNYLEEDGYLLEHLDFRNLSYRGRSALREYRASTDAPDTEIRELALKLGSDSSLSGTFIQGRIYDDFLWSMRLNVPRFSAAILLMSVQLSSGR